MADSYPKMNLTGRRVERYCGWLVGLGVSVTVVLSYSRLKGFGMHIEMRGARPEYEAEKDLNV